MRFICLFAAFILTTSSQAIAQSGENYGTHIVDESYIDASLHWNRGRRLGIFLTITEAENRYVICAATTQARRNHDRQALRALNITLNGEVMQRGLTWAVNHNSNLNSGMPIGRESTCILTNSAIVANPVFDIDLIRSQF